MNFVTDRNQGHVDLLKRLRKIPWENMTESEQALWYGEAAKGAYNHTDMNRVEAAVAELAERLGLELTTKTDWTVWDTPLDADLDRYLANVVAVRDACPGDIEFPILPRSMTSLTCGGANRIEEVLKVVYEEVIGSDDS